MLQKLRMAVENRYIADIKLQKAEQISETLSAQYGEDESNLQQMLEEYKQQVSQINPDVIGLKHLQEYDKKVEALLQAMAENDQLQNNGDEDIELMQGTVNVIDPITKKRMVDPMKNTCGHSYERESIIALLKSNKKMKCPVPGCRNKNSIEFSQLQPDIVLKTYLSQHPN
ncbi:E3 SUMO-protein ligase NSE2 isoform X2 [Cephus cinctus]|nr:E3 SUMO-protein ligase NSE2 isoform X2 [Cephus cinctus]XP_024942718.1 E3 SUMO-protein ligase NSE2 isoform X2 [Cephus cinctus]XP_024942719.1 E3 SUMO-protein ligase NSE2 isoform X2 [Cephus cinctus]